MNYFITGKPNANAEAINSKIQRFMTANFGVGTKSFLFTGQPDIIRSTSNYDLVQKYF